MSFRRKSSVTLIHDSHNDPTVSMLKLLQPSTGACYTVQYNTLFSQNITRKLAENEMIYTFKYTPKLWLLPVGEFYIWITIIIEARTKCSVM